MVAKKRRGSGGSGSGSGSTGDEAPAARVCHHARKDVDAGRALKQLKKAARADGSLVCLRCGARFEDEENARRHHELPRSDGHAIVADLDTLVVRCLACVHVVDVEARQSGNLRDALERLRRFGLGPSARASASPIALEASPSPPPARPLAARRASPSPSPPPLGGARERRARGLANLGNTCFFNSVLQCLAQTPYLLRVLKQTAEPGERFELAGGALEPKRASDDEEPRTLRLPPIVGELPQWGELTAALAETLEDLQSTKTETIAPKKILNIFVKRVSQFEGGDQHDSHELLRHLLEAVRSEDLRRYQSALLLELKIDSKEKRRGEISDDIKQTLKFYGQQASDSVLRPGQVFRGLLVSTLECQECKHSSHTTEHFLDLSLPVTADKPQPPAVVRRKIQDDLTNQEHDKSKHQLKKDKNTARKMRKAKRVTNYTGRLIKLDDNSQSGDTNDNKSENKSSSEQSDADIEDNIDDNGKFQEDNSCFIQQREISSMSRNLESGYNSEKMVNSDSIRTSPVDLENKEKSDMSPEIPDKDNEKNIYKHIASEITPGSMESLGRIDTSFNPDSGVASPESSNLISTIFPLSNNKEESSYLLSDSNEPAISSKPYTNSNNSPDLDSLMNHMPSMDIPNYLNIVKADENDTISKEIESCKNENEIENNENCVGDNINNERNSLPFCGSSFEQSVKFLPCCSNNWANNDDKTLDNSLSYELSGPPRLTSPDCDSPKWKKEMSPFSLNRNLCEEGEYSIQSCLNQFTSSELLTGNNKVSCDACSKQAGKTVYTNATKRFRISSPPAVLILHLKRFQLGPRCVLRKITKHVNFPLILDLAPFCADKTKNPNTSTNQSKALYSLYGVVEHSGSTLHLGHYVAYVKIRPEVSLDDPRWQFLPTNVKKNLEKTKSSELTNGVCNSNDNDTDSSLSGYESDEGAVGGSNIQPSSGKWYFISDSRVVETTEEKVLGVQAYLLFYERVI